MQLALLPYNNFYKNNVFEITKRIHKFLYSRGLSCFKCEREVMNTFDQNEVLLLQYNAHIREQQKIVSNNSVNSIWGEEKRKYILDLHNSLYGNFKDENFTVEISTTTAILINEILCGNINENTYIQFQPSREINGNRLMEMEIALFDYTMPQVMDFYAGMLSDILERDIRLRVQPTYFSWASVSLVFKNMDFSTLRFGALGFIRDELLDLKACNDNKHICLLGIPIASLATILS